MTNKELVANAVGYLQVTTCYDKGFWCQFMSKSEYDRINAQYKGANDKYNNAKYVGTDIYAGDCICWIKQLLNNGKVGNRLSYAQMSSNPLGDCTNQKFYDSLYDCCEPSLALPGYGLATPGHAGLYIGNGQWLDYNYTGDQNGIKLHTGFAGTNFKCGKIPGVAYENDEPIINTEREILLNFCEFMVEWYLQNKR